MAAWNAASSRASHDTSDHRSTARAQIWKSRRLRARSGNLRRMRTSSAHSLAGDRPHGLRTRRSPCADEVDGAGQPGRLGTEAFLLITLHKMGYRALNRWPTGARQSRSGPATSSFTNPVSLGATARVPSYVAVARQRPTVGAVQWTVATPACAVACSARTNCQPASGSNCSSVTVTGPSTGGRVSTETVAAMPGATAALPAPLARRRLVVIVREARRSV